MNNKNINIVLISPAGYGGIQSWCIQYGTFLTDIGYNVTIIWEQDKSNQIQNPKVPNSINEINYLGGTFVNQYRALKRMINLLKGANIVYPNTSSIGYRALAGLGTNRPLIIAGCHSLDEHDLNTITQFEPICDAIFTLSKNMATILKKQVPESSHNKINIIRHGIDTNTKTLPLLLNKTIQLVFVGRLDDNKRPQLTIEITKKLLQKGINVKLKIIGDGPLKNKLSEIIIKNNLTKHIYLLGNLDKQDVNYIYSKSHFTLLLSKSEGFGLVVLEAMSNGSIPIVTDTVGAGEIIKNEYDGFIIKSENIIDDTINVVSKVSNQLKYLENLSLNARETAKKHNQKKSFEYHLKLFRSTIHLNNKPHQARTIKINYKNGILDNRFIPSIFTYYVRKLLY